jgi:hypothetical protein
MDKSDEQLVNQLKGVLLAQGASTAFGDEPRPTASEDDAQGAAFFQALNAFRAARAAGDRDAMAEAEARMQAAARAELAGDDACTT